MTGRAAWLLPHKLLVMFLLRLRWPMDAIITKFIQMFPEVSNNRSNESTKEPIGHSKKSIEYCQKILLAKGAYNLDTFWVNPAQGKLGYVLGLHALQYSVSTIARQLQERFPTLVWPQGYSKEEAVEIAVITYHEYAEYSGHISLISKHSAANAFVSSWVITYYQTCLQNNWAVEGIPGMMQQLRDGDGNMLPTVVFDEVVFILTRFVPGFANSWRANAVVVLNQNFMLQ